MSDFIANGKTPERGPIVINVPPPITVTVPASVISGALRCGQHDRQCSWVQSFMKIKCDCWAAFAREAFNRATGCAEREEWMP